MLKDNGENKTKLGSLNDVLDSMLYGAKTPREARMQQSLDRHLLRKKGIRNKAR